MALFVQTVLDEVAQDQARLHVFFLAVALEDVICIVIEIGDDFLPVLLRHGNPCLVFYRLCCLGMARPFRVAVGKEVLNLLLLRQVFDVAHDYAPFLIALLISSYKAAISSALCK